MLILFKSFNNLALGHRFNLDNKTSHTFIPLNLHSVFGWLFNENREYDNIAEALNEI